MKYEQIKELPLFNSGLSVEEILLSEPPKELVIESVSDVTGDTYRQVPIEHLEAVMDILFPGSVTDFSVSVTEKECHADVRADVTVTFGNFMTGRKWKGVSFDTVKDEAVIRRKDDGTVYPAIIKYNELLKNRVPLAITEAKKMAIRNIANVFGRNLNRGESLLAEHVVFQKVEPDAVILKKYKNAKKKGDEKTVSEIESTYNVPTND